MDISPRFETIWNRFDDFTIPKDAIQWCPYARKFAQWSATLLASHQSDLVEVNQAKVMLFDKYFEWRSLVPRSHRNRIGPGGHRCIFHVAEQTYEKLRLIELSLMPPPWFIPPPPLPPPQIGEIFIGDLGGNSNE